MTNLFKTLSRSGSALSFSEWANYFSFNGSNYPLGLNQTLGGKEEEIGSDFAGYVEGGYKRNGVVFACMLARMLLFSEARFQYRRMSGGRPGDLFGDQSLQLLERPWPNGTTGDLLTRAIVDVDLAGNFYATRRPGNRIQRLRPDWVTIVMGSARSADVQAGDLDAEVVGYIYHPGGRNSGRDPVTLLRDEVAHFAPIPDPTASFRGMSWLTPIIREITADGAATTHKLKFFENGATANLVVTLGDAVKNEEGFRKWVAALDERHRGHFNAYETLYLGAGADAKVVGADMRQIDFKVTQGAGETRIAAAARVPPIIVGLSEGLDSATYSNYGQARRAFADHTMRPLWRNVAGSLATLVQVPPAAELWYDDRDIPFLQEDQKDAAEIRQADAITIRELVNAGYEPKSVVSAVQADDFSLLVHTGLVSVQLQPPGTKQPVGQNGNGNGAVPALN